jgi:hypothetical protein
MGMAQPNVVATPSLTIRTVWMVSQIDNAFMMVAMIIMLPPTSWGYRPVIW